MWPFIEPINLIRYLCVWRVNRALVRLPANFPFELAHVLGSTIAERLPTRQARPWHKALADETTRYGWPIEVVLFPYPGKTLYGPGEPIVWELKLLGPQADHAFFLETILPAMEAAGSTADPRWYQSNTLWGRFDVAAIYVARGSQWEPLVKQGRLDTRYQPTPLQWGEGLSFTPQAADNRTFKTITWLTPVDLRPPLMPNGSLSFSPAEAAKADQADIPVPTLQLLLEMLLARVAQLVPGKYTTPADVWNMLPPDEQTALEQALFELDRVQMRETRGQKLPQDWLPGWLGEQTFGMMPPSLLPYLELGSILHLGRHTHLGYGTFAF